MTDHGEISALQDRIRDLELAFVEQTARCAELELQRQAAMALADANKMNADMALTIADRLACQVGELESRLAKASKPPPEPEDG